MKEKILKNIPLFATLPVEEINSLSAILQAKEIPEGTFVFCEGEPGRRFFIIVEGQVDIIKAQGTEDERLLATRPAGSIVGEMSLFNTDGTHTATVRARSPLTVLEMTHSELDALLQRQPTLAYEMVRIISRRLTESENQTIRDLREKNLQLTEAYNELKAVQAQIIEKVHTKLGLTKRHSIETVESLLEIIKGSLESGEDVLVSGFGKFQVKHKKERRGRNPATGDDMMLSARKIVTFKCSGKLRNRVNGTG